MCRVRSAAWRVYLAASLLGIVAYAVPDDAVRGVIFSAAGLGCAGAMWCGIRLHRVPRSLPWRMAAAGVTLIVVGDLAWEWIDRSSGGPVPFPALPDAAYLAGYLCLAAGLALLLRRVAQSQGGSATTEALVVAVVMSLLSFHFLIAPYVQDPAASLLHQAVSLAYPGMDLLFLALLTRLLLEGAGRNRALQFVVIGLVGTLVSDARYAVASLEGTYDTGLIDVGWLVQYALLGAALLHPSVTAAAISVARGPLSTSRRRVLGLAVTGVVGPGLLIVGAAWRGDIDLIVGAVASILLLLLVLRRLDTLLNTVESSTAELRHRAHHDGLTGLVNRRYFAELLAEAIRDHPPGEDVGVLFVDLDGFKAVNDSSGHTIGDRLLRAVADRCEATVHPPATSCRLGGDEFAILLPRIGEPAEAARLGAEVLAMFGEPFEVEGVPVMLGASVGLAVGSVAGYDVDALLAAADVAMYVAKRQGKGRFVTYRRGMTREVIGPLQAAVEVRKALRKGELEVHYQPIVELPGGRLWGVEALVRWRQPDGPILAAGEFLPLAEEGGHISDVDRMVLETAVADLAAWRGTGWLPGPCLTLNASAATLTEESYPQRVVAVAAAHKVPLDRLVIEITETATLVRADAALAQLQRLRKMGVMVALDDFGTGYSTLAYLQQFPVDLIKIAKPFIDPIKGPRPDSRITTAVTTLAHSLGVAVVAEGVETAGQHDQLVRLGCQYAQGYRYGRPAPARTISVLALASLTDYPVLAGAAAGA